MKKYITMAVFTASVALGSAAVSAATQQENVFGDAVTTNLAYDRCEYYLTGCTISPTLCRMLYEHCKAQQNR